MTKVSEESFNAFVNAHARAYPNGFRRVAVSVVQTRWLEDGREVARRTDDRDSGESFYEILSNPSALRNPIIPDFNSQGCA